MKEFEKTNRVFAALGVSAIIISLIAVLTFYLNPLFLLIKKPTLAELITGTRVISTISKKR